MKKKLNKEELESISGGFLKCDENGRYVMYGMPEMGGIPFEVRFGKDLHLAVEYDWKWFEDIYKANGIYDMGQLEEYYKNVFIVY